MQVEDDELRGAVIADISKLVNVHDVDPVHAVQPPKLAVVPERHISC